jgi:hypothetical protein
LALPAVNDAMAIRIGKTEVKQLSRDRQSTVEELQTYRARGDALEDPARHLDNAHSTHPRRRSGIRLSMASVMANRDSGDDGSMAGRSFHWSPRWHSRGQGRIGLEDMVELVDGAAGWEGSAWASRRRAAYQRVQGRGEPARWCSRR